MGKLIVVVGNTGVGKTALVRALCRQGSFVSGLEEHLERPFQNAFKADVRYALANQLDYLLLRAEQERLLRKSKQTGLMDGGLEMDFHGFTRLFLARGWLTIADFDLCKRFYDLVRRYQPPPDFILYLTANPEVISQRMLSRRRISIAEVEDIPRLDLFLNEWVSSIDPGQVLRLDVSEIDYGYKRLLPSLLEKLQPFQT
jgi:deoxyadenosine/deoxycytidine kinase